jgi:hypothetical protein
MLEHALSCAIVGAPETVRSGLEAFIARTGADELEHDPEKLQTFRTKSCGKTRS